MFVLLNHTFQKLIQTQCNTNFSKKIFSKKIFNYRSSVRRVFLKIEIPRNKKCSTETAFWRIDPRLDHIPIEEVPIPKLMHEEGKGCGIRMDMNMKITSIRPNSHAAINGLKPGKYIYEKGAREELYRKNCSF